VTELHSTTTITPTPTTHALAQVQKRRLDLAHDRITALEDQLNRIESIFQHKVEDRPRTVNENIAALDFQLNMQSGENMRLWRELDKLEGGLAAIHRLLAPRRGHAASGNRRRPPENGASPFESTREGEG
jgi:hypothetical protein|tara:strand:+ start:1932 stop:2321 length:390 start_codon:yes stop_codon:yes gene_type:complete